LALPIAVAGADQNICHPPPQTAPPEKARNSATFEENTAGSQRTTESTLPRVGRSNRASQSWRSRGQTRPRPTFESQSVIAAATARSAKRGNSRDGSKSRWQNNNAPLRPIEASNERMRAGRMWSETHET
jgi:hypothetical protein